MGNYAPDNVLKKGRLTGVGIGPGDPELLTIKAVKALEEADVIAFPGAVPEETVAYRIIKDTVDLSGKALIGIDFPMTKDPKILDASHREGAGIIREYLDRGLNAAFPTLGDPTVYSTYMYVHRILRDTGYDTEIVPGVTSFCAAAALMNDCLTVNKEQLHIIPSSYDTDDALMLPGTKIFMKAGSKMDTLLKKAKEKGLKACIAENVGMPGERVLTDPETAGDTGYYAIMIIKDGDKQI